MSTASVAPAAVVPVAVVPAAVAPVGRSLRTQELRQRLRLRCVHRMPSRLQLLPAAVVAPLKQCLRGRSLLIEHYTGSWDHCSDLRAQSCSPVHRRRPERTSGSWRNCHMLTPHHEGQPPPLHCTPQRLHCIRLRQRVPQYWTEVRCNRLCLVVRHIHSPAGLLEKRCSHQLQREGCWTERHNHQLVPGGCYMVPAMCAVLDARQVNRIRPAQGCCCCCCP